MVRTPVKNHATSSQPALPIWRDMSAETIKIPEPIITPTTTITESKRPRPRAKAGVCGAAAGETTGALVVINILVILVSVAWIAMRIGPRRMPRGFARRRVREWKQEVCEEASAGCRRALDA